MDEKEKVNRLRALLYWRMAVLDQELHTRSFTDVPSVADGIREQIAAILTLLNALPPPPER